MEKFYSSEDVSQVRDCVFCGEKSATLSSECQDFQYGSGAESTTLKAEVPVWTCGACELQFTDGSAEIIRHKVVCVHLGRLCPEEVRAVREQHDLTQEQFAKLTGIGVASIRRWESGNLIQNEALDRYLRLLRVKKVFNELQSSLAVSSVTTKPRFRTPITELTKNASRGFQLRPRTTFSQMVA